MQATSIHRIATIRTRAIRVGAAAGMLTPVPVVIAAAVTLKEGENIRQYGIPWLLAASAVLVRSCLAGVHAVQISSGLSASSASDISSRSGRCSSSPPSSECSGSKISSTPSPAPAGS